MALKRKEKKIEKLDTANSTELDCYKEKLKTISNLVPFYLEAGIISPDIFKIIKKIEKKKNLPNWITDIGENYIVVFETLFFVEETFKEIDVIINRNYPDKKFIIENLENGIQDKIKEMVFKYNIVNGKYILEEEEVYETKSCISRG